MELFLTAFINVLILLVCAVPGYIFIKTGMLKKETIKAFSTVLMYFCQPLLIFYSFQMIDRTQQNTIDMVIAFAISLITSLVMIAALCLIFHKKFDRIEIRTGALCGTFGNVAFLGIPLIENLLPEYANGPVICGIFLIVMTLLGWTLACHIITQDKKYISIRKILLNPGIIAIVISILCYALNFHIVDIPTIGEPINKMVTIIGKMCTPMCMLILGMRLATMDLKMVFLKPFNYLVICIKQIIMPLLVFLAIYFLPFDNTYKIAIVVISAAPVAQIMQNFTEMVGQGQDECASYTLLGTMLSIITMPCICLLFSI